MLTQKLKGHVSLTFTLTFISPVGNSVQSDFQGIVYSMYVLTFRPQQVG